MFKHLTQSCCAKIKKIMSHLYEEGVTIYNPPFFLKVMFDIRVTVCFEKKHLVPVFGQMTNKQIM
jgi:hypothetical protein